MGHQAKHSYILIVHSDTFACSCDRAESPENGVSSSSSASPFGQTQLGWQKEVPRALQGISFWKHDSGKIGKHMKAPSHHSTHLFPNMRNHFHPFPTMSSSGCALPRPSRGQTRAWHFCMLECMFKSHRRGQIKPAWNESSTQCLQHPTAIHVSKITTRLPGQPTLPDATYSMVSRFTWSCSECGTTCWKSTCCEWLKYAKMISYCNVSCWLSLLSRYTNSIQSISHLMSFDVRNARLQSLQLLSCKPKRF